MKFRSVLSLVALCMISLSAKSMSPVDSLAMRVTEGTSAGRIIFNEIPSAGPEFFEISADSGRVVIDGNSKVALATGLNWYLKYVAGIHISWNNLTQPLPDKLPLPKETIRKKASVADRYYLNYCTFSYSMPFWDEERWMKEIDWMALHGINMPLMMTGIETVWRNLLKKLGYDDEEIGRFISGPAFLAWWQMNNLEGWGGPLPDQWYDRQSALQHKIVARMRSLGIEPVYPGYAGMVPHDINSILGYKVADPGKWCGFVRPAFLSPDTEEFSYLADLYYQELDSLYGKAKYYSMDPFHEGGNTSGVDLPLAGRRIADRRTVLHIVESTTTRSPFLIRDANELSISSAAHINAVFRVSESRPGNLSPYRLQIISSDDSRKNPFPTNRLAKNILPEPLTPHITMTLCPSAISSIFIRLSSLVI